MPDSYEDVSKACVDIDDVFVFITHRHPVVVRRQVYSPLSVACFPDCLLKNESHTTTYLRKAFQRQVSNARRGMCNQDQQFSIDMDDEMFASGLQCNARLLSERIRMILEELDKALVHLGWRVRDPSEALRELLSVNQACDCPVELTISMFETCIRLDTVECLKTLLDYNFQTPWGPEEGGFIHPYKGRKTFVTESHLMDLERQAGDLLDACPYHKDDGCLRAIEKKMRRVEWSKRRGPMTLEQRRVDWNNETQDRKLSALDALDNGDVWELSSDDEEMIGSLEELMEDEIEEESNRRELAALAAEYDAEIETEYRDEDDW